MTVSVGQRDGGTAGRQRLGTGFPIRAVDVVVSRRPAVPPSRS
jgi:hypothetical protein